MVTGPEILNSEIAGVSVRNLVWFFVIILSTFIIRSIVLNILEKRMTILTKRTKTEIDDLFINSIKSPVGYIILLQGLYIAAISLKLPADIQGFIHKIYILLFSLIVLYFFFRIIDVLGFFIHREAKKSDSTLDDQLAPLIVKSLRILVVTVGVLSILQNFGYSITSLLAGLGIGGLAFALAAQDTVSNLFGSFTIFSDKPFKLGDWIEVGEFEGTVEEVGFRSTRIRRFDQAQVTVPNSKFIKTGVINYSEMKKRRIKFNLGVTYATSASKMTQVVEGIKNIIEKDKRFDHNFYMVHFTEFGDFSLNIFIYCFTKTTVWDEFLTVRESFNLQIMQLLEELGVEIAFPSQTIYLEKTGNDPFPQ